MRYAFMEEQRTHHCVRRTCTPLDVYPAGYYERRGRLPSARDLGDRALRAEMLRVHSESRRTYCRPRIHAELRAHGVSVGPKRIGRVMECEPV